MSPLDNWYCKETDVENWQGYQTQWVARYLTVYLESGKTNLGWTWSRCRILDVRF